MIEPFEPGQVREVDGRRIVSYGTSSYGYDIRCSREFKIFTNINSTIVDPKAFDAGSFVDFTGDVCIIPPNSFALARTVEYFRIPRNVLVVCLGKVDVRTLLPRRYARCAGRRHAARRSRTWRAARSGEVFWGYSIGEHGRLIVSLLDAPRYIGRDALLEVELDNGEVIHATPDHDSCCATDAWYRRRCFGPARSLMPLYREPAPGLRDGLPAAERASCIRPIGWLTSGICGPASMQTCRNAPPSHRFRSPQQSADEHRAHAGAEHIRLHNRRELR